MLPSNGWGEPRERFDNLIDMYEQITAETPYKVPLRIYSSIGDSSDRTDLFTFNSRVFGAYFFRSGGQCH